MGVNHGVFCAPSKLSRCTFVENVFSLSFSNFWLFVVVSLLQKRLEERAAEIEKKTKEKREKDIQERLK